MNKLVLLALLGIFPAAALASGSDDHSHGNETFSVGKPGHGRPDRQIRVSMTDNMRFTFEPRLESLRHGQTIEFIVRNDGQLAHEFSIGNAEDQVKHAEMMRKMPDMKHQDPNTVSLGPGEQARLLWQFMGKDTVVFACNIPGHFEAGMKHMLAIGAN
ncbi:MAG: cupredoxin family protein [Gammaproteobacteria bacterium]|nr:cupredoxin family protein [Gammaproteobacteria bacterium]